MTLGLAISFIHERKIDKLKCIKKKKKTAPGNKDEISHKWGENICETLI